MPFLFHFAIIRTRDVFPISCWIKIVNIFIWIIIIIIIIINIIFSINNWLIIQSKDNIKHLVRFHPLNLI